MRVPVAFLFCFFLGVDAGADALESGTCGTPSLDQASQYTCQSCESDLISKINMLMDRAADPKAKDAIRSPEDFVAELIKIDPALEKNKLVIGSSLSVQDALPGKVLETGEPGQQPKVSTVRPKPRVVFKSSQSEVFIGVSTDPKSDDYGKVEIMMYDANPKVSPLRPGFKFKEVDFRQVQAKKRVRHDASQDCKRCHSPDLKPNWDTYRAWAGLLPPKGDELLPLPEPTTQAWISFYKSVVEAKEEFAKTGKANRLALLTIPYFESVVTQDEYKTLSPRELLDRITFELRGTGLRVPHSPQTFSDGAAVNTFDQLSILNACKISGDLMANKDYPKFKYALASVSERCNTDASDLIPERASAGVVSFFSSRGHSGVDMPSVLRSVEVETRKIGKSLDVEKTRRHKAYIKSLGFSQKVADEHGEVDGVGEDSSDRIAGARFILEPLGIRVGNWSMSFGDSLAKPHYNFADRYELPAMEAIRSVREEFNRSKVGGNYCDWLQQKSKENYPAVAVARVAPYAEDCEQLRQGKLIDSEKLSSLNKMVVEATDMLLIKDAKSELSSCFACHNTNSKGPGTAPRLPFGPSESAQLSSWLNQKKKGSDLTGLQVIERALSHSGKGGVPKMPPTEKLDRERQGLFLGYLSSLAALKSEPKKISCEMITRMLAKPQHAGTAKVPPKSQTSGKGH